MNLLAIILLQEECLLDLNIIELFHRIKLKIKKKDTDHAKESSGKTKIGRISKQGSPWLRWIGSMCNDDSKI